MTAPGHRRHRLPLAELYVLLCTGLALLWVTGVAGPPALVALVVLLMPAGIVPLALALNVVFLADGLPAGGVGQAAGVLFVAGTAVVQAWMFRTIARNWRRTDVEVPPAPVSAGADTGL